MSDIRDQKFVLPKKEGLSLLQIIYVQFIALTADTASKNCMNHGHRPLLTMEQTDRWRHKLQHSLMPPTIVT